MAVKPAKDEPVPSSRFESMPVSRFSPLILAAVIGLFPAVASAQASTSTTRSSSVTTQEGNTTRTVTRSTTVGAKASIDEEKLGAAIAGALIDRLDPEEARLRRLAEPARPEDVFGAWAVSDGGSDAAGCRFDMAEKTGLLGVRAASATGCPRRLERLAKWRVQNGELVFYSGVGEELKRLRFVEGRFVGGGLELKRD